MIQRDRFFDRRERVSRTPLDQQVLRATQQRAHFAAPTHGELRGVLRLEGREIARV